LVVLIGILKEFTSKLKHSCDNFKEKLIRIGENQI